MLKLMAALRRSMEAQLDSDIQPVVELPPPPPRVVGDTSRYSHRSIETLVVVLAVITIAGVIASIIARLCGGRHFGGSGENDIEGWVEKQCKSCIDGGLPPSPPPAAESKPPAPAPAPSPAPAEEAKK